ncbi:MAG: hypothetical protein K8R53_15845, partial [Bacteroidales bacterium]|nr:hypothetical protein [Bacteroidales bacterium]
MGELQISENTIDIKKVFAAKNPGLARFIPGFVYNFLEKLIHLHKINDFIYKSKHLEGLEFADSALISFD